jgi:two-component system cell cycle response regulator
MSGPEVIMVEDDRSIARVVAVSLRREGYSVRSADTLSLARDLIGATDWDILLLDRRLPDGDGVTFCHEIREKNSHRYIILLTGDARQESKLAGFDCGADDYVTKPFQMDELLARVRAGRRIVELQKALLASNRRLEELARTDPLTGIGNRRSFDAELASRFEHARRYNRPLTLVMIDIDHFKEVNDTFGHQAGDEVLQRIARVLERTTRQSDFVARFGGEEFVVLLPETPLLEGLQVAEKIRAAVAAEDLPTRVTVSAGVATLPQPHIDSPDALVAAADAALYRAKESGRNRVEYESREENSVWGPALAGQAG